MIEIIEIQEGGHSHIFLFGVRTNYRERLKSAKTSDCFEQRYRPDTVLGLAISEPLWHARWFK